MSAPESPSLRSLQTAMMALLREPEGVQAALVSDPSHRWLLQQTVGDARASAEQRLGIYANMYFFRLLDSLRLDYPKVAATVGDAGFHNLITEYLLRHPSRDPSLRGLGRDLPQFLRERALEADVPYLADLAALEWARLDVFDRVDEPVLTYADLALHAQQGFAALHLRAIDACVLVGARHDVVEIWRHLQAGGAVAATNACPQTLLVWRKPDRFVYHRALESDETSCLALLQSGVSFVDLCSFLATERSATEAAERALGLLSTWSSDGLLRSDFT